MTTKIRTLMLALITLFGAATFTSCSDDNDGPDFPSNTLYDIVTFESSNESGTTFTLQKDGDSPLITYHSSRQLSTDDNVKAGARLLIAYTIPDSRQAYTSGEINLLGYRSVYNGDIIVGESDDYASFLTQDQRITYLTRTGKYINVGAEIYVLNAPKTYQLVVDKATLGEAYPTAYIIFISDTTADGTIHQGYGSWDISAVWDLPTCKGLTLRVSDPSGQSEYKFEKTPDITPID